MNTDALGYEGIMPTPSLSSDVSQPSENSPRRLPTLEELHRDLHAMQDRIAETIVTNASAFNDKSYIDKFRGDDHRTSPKHFGSILDIPRDRTPNLPVQRHIDAIMTYAQGMNNYRNAILWHCRRHDIVKHGLDYTEVTKNSDRYSMSGRGFLSKDSVYDRDLLVGAAEHLRDALIVIESGDFHPLENHGLRDVLKPHSKDTALIIRRLNPTDRQSADTHLSQAFQSYIASEKSSAKRHEANIAIADLHIAMEMEYVDRDFVEKVRAMTS